jgi:hypothetical protein
VRFADLPMIEGATGYRQISVAAGHHLEPLMLMEAGLSDLGRRTLMDHPYATAEFIEAGQEPVHFAYTNRRSTVVYDGSFAFG